MDFMSSVGYIKNYGLDSHLHPCNVSSHVEEVLTTNLNLR